MANICMLVILFLLLCSFVSASVGEKIGSLKSKDLFVEAANRFSELFDDVEKMKDEITFIAEQLSNGEYEGSNENQGRPVTLEGARVTIAQIDETEAEILVHHKWGEQLVAKWLVGLFILPDELFPQAVTTDAISIHLPIEQVKNADVFPGPYITLTVSFGQTMYGFEFDIMSALNSDNKTFETDATYGELREDLKVYPFDVEPTDNILYTPGDVFNITFKMKVQKLAQSSNLRFVSVGPDPDEPVAITFDMRDHRLSKSIFSFPEPHKPTVQVDSSSLKTGGMLLATLFYESEAESVRYDISYRMIKLNLQDTKTPIPEGRVAILGKLYANQSMKVDAEQSHVSCEAVGNPPPNVQIRLNGQSIQTISADWVYDVGTMRTVYGVPAKDLIDGPVTCYAENPGDFAEMVINLEYELTAISELNKYRRLEGDMILEAECAFKGRPAPNITFYKDFYDESNVILEDPDTAEISRFQDGFFSQATLRLDISNGEMFRITCVGESNGRRETAYLMYDY